jgi:cell division protein ZapA (FtsZ GTPase activity inhibitor)
MKDKENYGLLKIPSEAVIKELRVELGKANAYIQELKERMKLINTKEVKVQTLINLEGRVKNLEKELEKSRKECNKVVQENIRMRKQLFDNELKNRQNG